MTVALTLPGPQSLPEAPIDIDTALVWLSRSYLAKSFDPRPRHESFHRDRLRGVQMLLRVGATRKDLCRMLADGRLERAERLIAATPGRSFARVEKRLRRVLAADLHHLYVIEVVGVGTKIGVSKRPSGRLFQHRGAARRWGRELGRVWFSVLHAEALANERSLIDSEPGRSEVLSASFDAVMELVGRMRMTSLDALFASWERAAAAYKQCPKWEADPEVYYRAVCETRAALAVSQ